MSEWHFSFSERFAYPAEMDITLPVILYSSLTNPVQIRAKLDTGSTFCIFQPRYAKLLDLDLTGGVKERIRTVVGSFTAYGHEVSLTVSGIEWSATVYFAEDEYFPVNVVGRIGFLDRLKVALVDYEQTLYLSAYEG